MKIERTFDYRARNGYEQSEIDQKNIPDDPSQLDNILKELKSNYKSHVTRDVDFRISQLKSLLKGIDEMKDELCEAIGKDLGRGKFYAYISELHLVKIEIKHTISHLKTWNKADLRDTPIAVGPGKSYVKPEPLGVIAVMSAWNYPLYTLLGPAHQVIAAGNCCLFKPSEIGPYCCRAIHKLIDKYLDQRYYKVIFGQTKVAIKLTSMRWDMIVFTGSTEKGKLVAASAGKNLVPCVLELGGKSPFIIDDSADPVTAAKKLLFGKMPNFGQVCIAPDYVLIHESKLNQFKKAFEKQLKDGYNNCETMEESGKIVSDFHYRRLCGFFADHGGEVITGNPNTHKDFDLKVSLILNPRKDCQLLKEEVFGPIFPVITYTDINEAIRYINEEQEKPLVVYYFGDRNGENSNMVSEQTSSGAFVVNESIYQILNPDLPFGGVGFSGYGRTHGYDGFKSFSNMKSYLVKPVLDFFPFNIVFPPYTQTVQKQTLFFLEYGNYTQCQFTSFTSLIISLVSLIVLISQYFEQISQVFTGKYQICEKQMIAK